MVDNWGVDLDKPVGMLATFYKGSFLKNYLRQTDGTNPMMTILTLHLRKLHCNLQFTPKNTNPNQLYPPVTNTIKEHKQDPLPSCKKNLQKNHTT